MSPNSFEQILLRQAARYPAWQAQDVYKLAYQAALGSEHAVSEPTHGQTMLLKELARLEQESVPRQAEPLIEPIRADGGLVRIHLRPLMEMKLSPARLLAGFLQSAKQFEGSRASLEAYLATAKALADQELLGVEAVNLRGLQEKMCAKGYPACHHSDSYTHFYHPAYRVLTRAAIPAEWLHFSSDLP